MNHKLNNSHSVAVSTVVYWQPMSTCPAGVKVQLRTKGGIAVYGVIRTDTVNDYQGWQAVPRRAPDEPTKEQWLLTAPNGQQWGGDSPGQAILNAAAEFKLALAEFVEIAAEVVNSANNVYKD